MNNTELYVDKNYFEILCISDYMHFIYSFYSIFIKNPVALDFLKKSLLALSDKEDIKRGIISNKSNRNFDLSEAMGSELIDGWFDLLESREIDPKSIFTGELFRWLIEPELNKIIPSRLIVQKPTTNRNNEYNNVGYFSNTLRRRSERKREEERQARITVNILESVEKEYNTNKLNEFTEQFVQKSKNNTSGTMSSILVSPNGTQLFKQSKPGYKKYHSNECQVYNKFYSVLQELSPKNIDKRTCFIRCYKNGILLRYGGISLYQMIKEKKIPDMDWFEELFLNIKILHLTGIAHNDLHCKNIVGDRAFLIDFGLARISDTDIDENSELFLNFINDFFFEFFYIFSKGIMDKPRGSQP
jgi:hypothetical protein